MVDIFVDAVLKKIVQYFVDELFEYAKKLMQAQEIYNLKAIDVLGYNILQLTEVSVDLKNEIYEYHHNLKKMIIAAADHIEKKQFRKNGINERQIDLTGHEKNRVLQIIENRRSLNLSFQTLHAVVQLFIKSNEKIKLNIKNSSNSSNEYYERLKNAILVFELIDFVYNYINDFEITGKDKLDLIKEEINNELKEQELKDEELKNKLLKQKKASVINAINKRIEDRRKIRKFVSEQWKEFENKIGKTDKQVQTIKGVLEELDVYRDDARNHIDSIPWARLAAIVQGNINIIDDLKEIDWNLLVDFTIEDLYRLTGKNIDHNEF